MFQSSEPFVTGACRHYRRARIFHSPCTLAPARLERLRSVTSSGSVHLAWSLAAHCAAFGGCPEAVYRRTRSWMARRASW